MADFLRVAWVTAKRELYAYALSPLSYLLAALFLVVQGDSFWLLCQTLGATHGTTGAVLAYFFGGTFLYWLFLLFLVALLTMRLLAEERQRGSLELLLSAAVPEGALLFGKFLGVFGFYVALWLPTGIYLALLGLYLGPQASLDLGAVFGGYLGTLLVGGSAIAIGALASALAPTPLVAAAVTFASLSLLLLGGLVAELYIDSPRLQALLAYGNLFQHLDEMARGVIDSRHIVYHLSLMTWALAVAARVLKIRPGDRRGHARSVAIAALGLGLLVGLNYLAAQHPRRADLTRQREHELSPTFIDLLRGLKNDGKEVAVTVLHAEPGGRDELFTRLRETLLRAEQTAAGSLRLSFIDVDRHHDRARLLAERYHIERDDLAQSALIVESSGRSKLIARRELGDLAPVEPGAPPRLAAYRGEEALGSAIATVQSGRTPTICFTRGHGEAEHDSLTGSGLSELSTALSRENLRTRAITAPELAAGLDGCDVLAIAGVERPFLAAESTAIARYLDGGGRLLLLAGALIDRGLERFLDTGLESLLLARGVRLAQAVAIDPAQRLGESLAFIVENSYGAHPITSALAGRRTLWPLARPVFPLAPLEAPAPLGRSPQDPPPPPTGTGHSGLDWRAHVLASTSDKGFGETELGTLRDGSLHFDAARDLAGPLPLAVAAQPIATQPAARIVVIGSTQLAWNDSLVLFNRDLLIASVKWLADAPLNLTIAPRRPSEIRLALTAEQERRLFLTLVVGLPFLVLLLGIGVRFLRRGG
jgi:ABC-2 type transport system permease protein